MSNLGILFVFKYFNFLNKSVSNLLKLFNISYNVPVLKDLIPRSLNFLYPVVKDLYGFFGQTYDQPAVNLFLLVGISFYTFQALSYTIDVYRGTREPEKHFGMFALYVSFFPTLLSGPIERSTRLLPQLYRKVEFDYDRVVNGLILMAWGFFQKLVIADRLAQYANLVYSAPQSVQRASPPDGDLLFRDTGLLRFFGIYRHRHRHGAGDGIRAHAELPAPLFLAVHRRAVAALAHLPHILVPRLPVYPPGRQSCSALAALLQHTARVHPQRPLARRAVDLRHLGRAERRPHHHGPGNGPVPHRRA